ncbi:PREDICTED: uncharacterized protein PF11_0213-like [Nicrophorus vespilloides]|uniref:Uncharacterized protein PF11_0213-like n=1 Tax=Nicrophorus vespilloides TaxID=110193 RepID=A0ABM1MQL5_NICVS|nr:PREDICTED: uncharacterized protein PF11_0213-like [Nicrophorus vespilloides]
MQVSSDNGRKRINFDVVPINAVKGKKRKVSVSSTDSSSDSSTLNKASISKKVKCKKRKMDFSIPNILGMDCQTTPKCRPKRDYHEIEDILSECEMELKSKTDKLNKSLPSKLSKPLKAPRKSKFAIIETSDSDVSANVKTQKSNICGETVQGTKEILPEIDKQIPSTSSKKKSNKNKKEDFQNLLKLIENDFSKEPNYESDKSTSKRKRSISINELKDLLSEDIASDIPKRINKETNAGALTNSEKPIKGKKKKSFNKSIENNAEQRATITKDENLINIIDMVTVNQKDHPANKSVKDNKSLRKVNEELAINPKEQVDANILVIKQSKGSTNTKRENPKRTLKKSSKEKEENENVISLDLLTNGLKLEKDNSPNDDRKHEKKKTSKAIICPKELMSSKESINTNRDNTRKDDEELTNAKEHDDSNILRIKESPESELSNSDENLQEANLTKGNVNKKRKKIQLSKRSNIMDNKELNVLDSSTSPINQKKSVEETITSLNESMNIKIEECINEQDIHHEFMIKQSPQASESEMDNGNCTDNEDEQLLEIRSTVDLKQFTRNTVLCLNDINSDSECIAQNDNNILSQQTANKITEETRSAIPTETCKNVSIANVKTLQKSNISGETAQGVQEILPGIDKQIPSTSSKNKASKRKSNKNKKEDFQNLLKLIENDFSKEPNYESDKSTSKRKRSISINELKDLLYEDIASDNPKRINKEPNAGALTDSEKRTKGKKKKSFNKSIENNAEQRATTTNDENIINIIDVVTVNQKDHPADKSVKGNKSLRKVNEELAINPKEQVDGNILVIKESTGSVKQTTNTKRENPKRAFKKSSTEKEEHENVINLDLLTNGLKLEKDNSPNGDRKHVKKKASTIIICPNELMSSKESINTNREKTRTDDEELTKDNKRKKKQISKGNNIMDNKELNVLDSSTLPINQKKSVEETIRSLNESMNIKMEECINEQDVHHEFMIKQSPQASESEMDNGNCTDNEDEQLLAIRSPTVDLKQFTRNTVLCFNEINSDSEFIAQNDNILSQQTANKITEETRSAVPTESCKTSECKKNVVEIFKKPRLAETIEHNNADVEQQLPINDMQMSFSDDELNNSLVIKSFNRKNYLKTKKRRVSVSRHDEVISSKLNLNNTIMSSSIHFDPVNDAAQTSTQNTKLDVLSSIKMDSAKPGSSKNDMMSSDEDEETNDGAFKEMLKIEITTNEVLPPSEVNDVHDKLVCESVIKDKNQSELENKFSALDSIYEDCVQSLKKCKTEIKGKSKRKLLYLGKQDLSRVLKNEQSKLVKNAERGCRPKRNIKNIGFDTQKMITEAVRMAILKKDWDSIPYLLSHAMEMGNNYFSGYISETLMMYLMVRRNEGNNEELLEECKKLMFRKRTEKDKISELMMHLDE